MEHTNHMRRGTPQTAEERADRLCSKAYQLEALCMLLWGQEGESFRGLSDDIQDRVMWLVSDLATEVSLTASDVVALDLRRQQHPEAA